MSRSSFSFGHAARINGIIVVASSALLAGCGGGDNFTTAPVYGTVTLNGKPVTGGTIMLTPINEGESKMSGKGAAGTVQEDGSFELTTYETGDGAVVGKHRVSYIAPRLPPAPAPAEGQIPPPAPVSPFYGAAPKTSEVEITSGDNTLTVELVK